MAITIKDNTRIQAIINNLRPRVSRALEDQLPKEKDEIVNRTLSGTDKDGNSFQAYDAQYRQLKDRVAVFGGSPVNLALTGDMLGSIDTDVSGGGGGPVTGKIEVTGGFNREKARFNSNRPFMGLDRQGKSRIVRAIRNAITSIRR